MKYMGSKRWMLKNGLGHLINDEIKTAKRFVDLFSGSAAVAHFAATRSHPIEVRAYDLQLFSTVLADAVISRDTRLEPVEIWNDWTLRAENYLRSHHKYASSTEPLPRPSSFTQKYVSGVRLRCAEESGFSLTQAYGGHYFSRAQALWLDALRCTLPNSSDVRVVALAALIQGASQSAASPGHTAQPFQPTRTAKQYLYGSWGGDLLGSVKCAFVRLCASFARMPGSSAVRDANVAVREILPTDVVFIDPPYSGVHYSRFYHVLETIADGSAVQVSGVGRYPPANRRPKSRYSLSRESGVALDELLKGIAAKGARVLLTFPDHACSNGLSGDMVGATAAQYFRVRRHPVENRFSTLGGTKSGSAIGNGREARQAASELIFVLAPK